MSELFKPFARPMRNCLGSMPLEDGALVIRERS